MSEETTYLRFDLQGAEMAGEWRHAQVVMRELATLHGFEITDAVPQSLFDCWEFRVRGAEGMKWPEFVTIATNPL